MSTAAANDQTIVRAELSYELEKLTVTVGDEIIVIPNVPAAMFDAQNDEEYNLLDTAVTRAQRKGWANIYTHSVDKLRDIAERERLAMEAEGLSREATAVMSAPVVPQVVAPQPAPVVAPQVPVVPVVAQPQQQTRRRRRVNPLASVSQEALVAAQAEKDALGDSMVRFEYDIPEEDESAWNAPHWLRLNGAFRSTKSVYVIRSKNLPVHLIAALRSHGVRLEIWRFHPEDTDMVQKLADRCTHEFAVQLHTSLITAIDKAAEQCRAAIDDLSEAEKTEKTMSLIQRRMLSKQRAALKVAQERLESAIKCAESFDLTEDTRHCIEGAREALAARRLALRSMEKSLGVKPRR